MSWFLCNRYSGRQMREAAAKLSYNLFPFDLRAKCNVPAARDGIEVSCIINFYGPLDLLAVILCSLAQQIFLRKSFEAVLVEDRGRPKPAKEWPESSPRYRPSFMRPWTRTSAIWGTPETMGSLLRGTNTFFWMMIPYCCNRISSRLCPLSFWHIPKSMP